MRAFNRWANKRALFSVFLGALACVVLLMIAAQWDSSESWSVRTQIQTRS